MTKSTQKTTKQTQHSHDDQVKELAQEVAEYDDVEIVAEVDIDNQAVSDVLIIRDTDTKADQADHTDDASKADDETVVDGVKQKKLKRLKKILKIKHKIFKIRLLRSLKSPKKLPKTR